MIFDFQNVIETSRVIKEAIEVSGEENIPVNIVIDGHWHKRVILFMKYIHSPTKIDDKDVDYRLFPVAEFLECEDVIEDMTRRFENLNHNEEDDIKVILSAMSYGIYETVVSFLYFIPDLILRFVEFLRLRPKSYYRVGNRHSILGMIVNKRRSSWVCYLEPRFFSDYVMTKRQ